jgi:beta-xylosidase
MTSLIGSSWVRWLNSESALEKQSKLTIIGNAIRLPEQLPMDWATTKINSLEKREILTGGLYAPTIRYRSGTFYILCTAASGGVDMSPDQDFAPRNFIITATDIENPDTFSDLIYFDFQGIDPSLFFDDDGTAYLQGSWIHGYNKEPATVIKQVQIDPNTGLFKSSIRDIWSGHTSVIPEGPHIYKKDGFYYLLAAEGGTHRQHMITMSRSRSIWGPYESYSNNPVLTTQSRDALVQCVGHGELFQDRDLQWWAVVLARREHGDSFPLGRETFLVPIEWPEDEFPSFPAVELSQQCNRVVSVRNTSNISEAVRLNSPKTLYLRTPSLQNYYQDGHNIVLIPQDALLTAPSGSLTFVGQRQTSLFSSASVAVASALESSNTSFGLTVYKDTYRHSSIEYNIKREEISLKLQTPGSEWMTVNYHSGIRLSSLRLFIDSSVESYTFSFSSSGATECSEKVVLGTVPCAALSGDDFTGVF